MEDRQINSLLNNISKKATRPTREMTMNIMGSFDNTKNKPQVGIFWYDSLNKRLFGVFSVDAETASGDYATIGVLHKNVWQYINNPNNNPTGINDYTQIPRGRIFFDRKANEYDIKCGSWITDEAIELIKNTFNLQNEIVFVEKDIHWELGNGWNE